ncbi:MAG: type I-C CRISPR-associated protein Cas8c/Csd1 [Thermodesulfobacteriota bacterium]
MILQALNEYYERKAAEPGSGIPPYGYGEQKISFCLVLSPAGELVQVVDLREGQGKKATPKLFVAPMLPSKRTSGIEANFSWDNTGYVLGADGKGRPEKTRQAHEAFRKLVHKVAKQSRDAGLQALQAFLASWVPERFSVLQGSDEILDANVVFRLRSDSCFLHDRPEVRQLWAQEYRNLAGIRNGLCLVTGVKSLLAKLHPDISGVAGAHTSGAPLVSFNCKAFESYGKEQSHNAPVGERAAFRYATALNFLARKGSRQRIRLGDATTVFWAERATPAEDLLAALFDPPSEDAGDAGTQGPSEDRATTALIREILSAAKAGRPVRDVAPALDPDVRFYILGISPNNARLAVRFWSISTFGELLERVGDHFRGLEIERQSDTEPEYLSLSRLVLETAYVRKKGTKIERDAEDVPPLLAGALTRSILTGAPYPRSFFTAILGRIRADRIVNYTRAAILKAYLTRNHDKEVPMSLDPERRDPAYRLGRLFALLEKAQKDATNPTATIRDRYFASASATPATVFPQLLRLGQHHISKGEYGGYTDKLIADVVDGIDELPKHLSLEDQGLFTLGYYHQRNALFRKTEKE